MKRNFGKIILLFGIILAGLIIFEYRKYQNNENTQETVKKIENKTDFYTIEAEYPIEPLDKDQIIKQFVEQQVEQKKEDWKIGGEIYNNEKNIEKQFPDRHKMVYSMNIVFEKFLSAKMGTVSYLFKIGEYTGGANGEEKIQTFTFDKNGKVDLESVINISDYQGKVPNDIALSNLIFEQIKNNKEIFPDENVAKQGLGLDYLKADGITLDKKKCNCDGYFYGSNLQNFVIKDDGLSFYFDKGKITFRAAGTTEVVLDWTILKPYLIN